MKECPTCKGRGKQTLHVTENGRKLPPMDIECVTCQGQRHITNKMFSDLKWEEKQWCSCGKSEQFDLVFYNDGENPNCYKHNWCCGNCGKIVQVG